ncbi:Gfo/Idh/MocA family oxidoreductase [uncultured Roseobacter sp.]|uniref:Gfo/Idh/MocA family protein n=1 Tax=uncultured Roseobacter sp. TaxID=114847 RepID=UPI00262F228E|nr:Gfo/Idh/MocA family oxidoreductase [uncultured Roseobacter sp.]
MKTVLIGLGMVAETHLLAIRDATPQVMLSGVMGRNRERAEAFAQKASRMLGYPVPVLGDMAAVLSARPDFVIVATPPDARMEITTALAAEKIPILMEKPVERSLPAAVSVVTLCERAGVPLGIVLQHRAREASQALQKALANNELGQIATVDIRVPWWRDQAYYDAPGRGTYARDGGGVMINQAIHSLDLALWLLGPVRSLTAMMHRTPLHSLEAEDWAATLLQMENGAAGVLTATTAAFPGGAESISVQGTQGCAHLASGVLTLTDMSGGVESVGETAATGGGADPMAFTHAWHQTVLEDFVTSLAQGREPLASGRSALAAQAVITAMATSSETGQRTEVERV